MVFAYAFTGMSANCSLWLANTRSGSMMMDFGIAASSLRESHPAQRLYIFNLGLQNLQESRAGRAVDDLMVAGERESDGVDKFHLSGAPDRLHLDGADAEDGDLRRVKQRREALDAKRAQIANREGAAGKIVGRDRAIHRLRGEVPHPHGELIQGE